MEKKLRYLIQQPRTLQNMAVKKLGEWIRIQAYITSLNLEERDPDEAEAILSQQIEVIRNCVECNVPRTAHNAVAIETMRELNDLLVGIHQSLKLKWDESNNQMKLIARIIETLFTKHLTSLTVDCRDVCQAALFLPSLCAKSHKLVGLINLDIYLHTNVDITSLLKKLHNLKHLSLSGYICSLDNLKCVTDHCKHIETLQFNHDDDCCTIIYCTKTLDVPNLRRIDVQGILEYSGIEKLLLSCQNIGHIGLKPHRDRSVDIHPDVIANTLQNISVKDAVKQFNLKSYKIFRGTSLEQLKLVIEKCPLIENISLKRWHWLEDEMIPLELAAEALSDLRNLRKLELRHYDFHKHHVEEVLKVKGYNLMELRLKDVNMDIIALKCISEMCPNLESLHIKYCNIETFGYDPYDGTTLQYRNLKQLFFFTWYIKTIYETRQIVFHLLSSCLNIEFIATNLNILTNGIMSQVLIKNPMISLKEVKLIAPKSRKSKLSKSVLKRMTQNSVNSPVVMITEPYFCDSDLSD